MEVCESRTCFSHNSPAFAALVAAILLSWCWSSFVCPDLLCDASQGIFTANITIVVLNPIPKDHVLCLRAPFLGVAGAFSSSIAISSSLKVGSASLSESSHKEPVDITRLLLLFLLGSRFTLGVRTLLRRRRALWMLESFPFSHVPFFQNEQTPLGWAAVLLCT